MQVSAWIRELSLTGGVILGREKNEKQLNELQNYIREQKETIKAVEKKHVSILRKREYYKLNKGQVFYIVSYAEGKYKVGYEGVDINKRLEAYRTLVPDTKLCYVAYCENAYLLEQTVLLRFDGIKLEKNHEVIINICLKDLLMSVNNIIEICGFKVSNPTIEEIEKYNIS